MKEREDYVRYLNRISTILNMKSICEKAKINYQVYRNAKTSKFKHISDEALKEMATAVYTEVKIVNYL